MTRLWAALTAAMEIWHQGKVAIESAISIQHDALHVLAGVLVWLAAGMLFRRTLGSWLPWLSVLLVILWNEWVDLAIEHWPVRNRQYGESLKDVLLTMALPTLLLLMLRLRPELFGDRGRLGRRR